MSKKQKESEEYQRFEKLAKQLISVPKSEIDKREAGYQKQKKAETRRKAARFSGTAAGLLLLCTLSGISILSRASVQDKQPQTAKPDFIRTGEYTQWGYGPEGSFAKTGVIAPDGSSLTIYDYAFKSGKRIKELQKNCTKDALRVVEGSKMRSAKGRAVGQRTLAVFRDGEGRESAVLCRSDNKKMLTMIYGKTVEHVLGFERKASRNNRRPDITTLPRKEFNSQGQRGQSKYIIP